MGADAARGRVWWSIERYESTRPFLAVRLANVGLSRAQLNFAVGVKCAMMRLSLTARVCFFDSLKILVYL